MTVAGSPSNAGDYALVLKCSDGVNTDVTSGLNVKIVANLDPVLVDPPKDAEAIVGVAFTHQLPAIMFTDPEGDSITITITADKGSLPTFISFDLGTLTLSGTPGKYDAGKHSLKATGSDASDASTDATFFVTVIGKISFS